MLFSNSRGYLSYGAGKLARAFRVNADGHNSKDIMITPLARRPGGGSALAIYAAKTLTILELEKNILRDRIH